MIKFTVDTQGIKPLLLFSNILNELQKNNTSSVNTGRITEHTMPTPGVANQAM